MLTKPSPAALRALNALQSQTGWQEIVKFLSDELGATLALLAEATDDVKLRQMQGRAQFIKEFQKLVDEAPKVLEKLRVSTL